MTYHHKHIMPLTSLKLKPSALALKPHHSLFLIDVNTLIIKFFSNLTERESRRLIKRYLSAPCCQINIILVAVETKIQTP